jgi:hypothetical protein
MDTNIVAVGPYISCEVNKHLQSFFVCLDRRGVQILEKIWRCPNKNEERVTWIHQTEVVIKLAIERAKLLF